MYRIGLKFSQRERGKLGRSLMNSDGEAETSLGWISSAFSSAYKTLHVNPPKSLSSGTAAKGTRERRAGDSSVACRAIERGIPYNNYDGSSLLCRVAGEKEQLRDDPSITEEQRLPGN